MRAAALAAANAAAAAEAEAEAAAGRWSQPVVRWARRGVLCRLNRGADGGAAAHLAAPRTKLCEMLRRTARGIENASCLLVGQRGAGKHCLLSAAVREAEAGGEAPPFLRVDLQPLLVETERTALYSIAAQLGVLDAVKEKAHPNFCDGLRHMHGRVHGRVRGRVRGTPSCAAIE